MLKADHKRAAKPVAVTALAILATISFVAPARAGNGANFVTYDHHTEDKGVTEISVLNDLSRTAGDGERYNAQLLEIEHALTDQWIVAAYLESHKENGEDWSFDGFRLETRYRLFDYGTPFNPVVYLEYINKKEGALYLREVTGRVGEEGGEEEDENKRENELETKLILGHDVSDKLRLGLDGIAEVNLKTGDWAFGYATGLTYTMFEVENRKGWDVKEVKLGAELFGGLGDSVEGLTLDGSETVHYAGLNLKTEFANGAQVMFGAALGLTSNSEDFLFRSKLSWEFE